MNARRRAALEQILTAAANIREDTAGADEASFCADRRAAQLVERNLEIISEASRRLPDVMKDRRHQIPWRKIADIGNKLRHEYHDIDRAVLWEIVQNDLEPLKTAVEAMAEEEEL